MSEHQEHGCEYCDTFGGKKTYANQVAMPLNGKVQCIDHCIHHIVAALNAGGVRTTMSCCGHNRTIGYIGLEDGRSIYIVKEHHMDLFRKSAELAGVYDV